ncbi:MAG: ABC transporter permease [Thermoguttaceae bacterium]
MILEKKVLPFEQWIGPAFLHWAGAMGILLLLALIVSFIIAVLRYGFRSSFVFWIQAIQRGFADFFLLSPRRTWAIARLTVKESIRRRVLIVCLVFLVILMFAGWYLDPSGLDPARLYLSFVLSATSYLVLLLGLFLSAFGLPTEIKTKTIYTIVTKPVRPSEIVLGRMLGVTVVGSVILAFMTIMSYFFVNETLNHRHILTEQADLTEVPKPGGIGADNPRRLIQQGETRIANAHRHRVEIYADGSSYVDMVNGHTHTVRVEEGSDRQKRYIVEPAVGTMQARVPVYGKLLFRGQDGWETDRGVNTGNEWGYRSYISGGGVGLSVGSGAPKDVANQNAAFWTFSEITPEKFPNGLPIEMTFWVFRTHKGDIEKRINATLSLRNPQTGLFVDVAPFSTDERLTKSLFIPREIESGFAEITQNRKRLPNTGKEIFTPSDAECERNEVLTAKRPFDLFEDLCSDGNLEIWLRCDDIRQYIGVAEADLYIRGEDASILLNFAKGFFGIWQQMVLVIAFGVVLSTFLSGPVSMLATLGITVAGFFKSLLLSIGLLRELGGGPTEAFVRLVTQKNLVIDLPTGFSTTFVKAVDFILGMFLAIIAQVIPPLSDFYLNYLALSSGFDIPINWLLQNLMVTLGYAFPLFITGYLILSRREIAR